MQLSEGGPPLTARNVYGFVVAFSRRSTPTSSLPYLVTYRFIWSN